MARVLAVLAFVVYPLAEIAVTVWAAGRIGWGWVLIVFGVQLLAGLLVMRHAGSAAARGWAEASRRGSLPGGDVGDAALLFLAGLLLAVPGLLTDVVALVLLVPPTRRLVRSITGRTVGRRIRARGYSVTTATVDGMTVTRLHEGDVIAGRVVDSRDDAPDAAEADPAGPGTTNARDDQGPPRALPQG